MSLIIKVIMDITGCNHKKSILHIRLNIATRENSAQFFLTMQQYESLIRYCLFCVQVLENASDTRTRGSYFNWTRMLFSPHASAGQFGAEVFYNELLQLDCSFVHYYRWGRRESVYMCKPTFTVAYSYTHTRRSNGRAIMCTTVLDTQVLSSTRAVQ